MKNNIDIRGDAEVAYDQLAERNLRIARRKQLEEQLIQHMLSDELTTVNPIAVARGIMRETLDDDGGFRQGYIANIAMTIYDHSPGMTSISHCNHLAELILQKVFYSE